MTLKDFRPVAITLALIAAALLLAVVYSNHATPRSTPVSPVAHVVSETTVDANAECVEWTSWQQHTVSSCTAQVNN
jgi:hypothetical protein